MTEMLDIAMRFKGWRRRYARFFALRAFEVVNEVGDDLGSWIFRPKPLTQTEVVALVRSQQS